MIVDFVRSIFRAPQHGGASPVSDGYVGPAIFGVDKMPFQITVKESLVELKIDLADFNYLHLANISFLVNDTWLSLQDYDNLVFLQSSVANNDEALDIVSVANGSSAFFSTRKERKPYVIIRFPEPVQIDAVRLVNRRDGLWQRARNLRVFGRADGVEWRCFYDGADLESRMRWLTALISRLEAEDECVPCARNLVFALKGAMAVDAVDSQRVRSSLDAFFSEFVFPADSAESIRFLSSRLAYSLSQVFCFFDHEFGFFTARFVINMLVCHGYKRDAFKLYTFAGRSQSMGFSAAIEADVDVIGRSHYNYPLISAAHTFARPLSSYPRETLLDTIDTIMHVLDDPEWSLMLCYGTLLGFYRDNDFIAHDDDIDLLCISNVKRDQLKLVAGDIVERLNLAGFRAKMNINNRRDGLPFVQVFSKAHKVHVDIFLAYESEGEIFLPMRNVNYSSVPRSIMLPAAREEFFGRSYTAPSQIEDFLEARYGAGWSVPDKHFRANEHGKR